MKFLNNLHAFCWPDDHPAINCNTYFIEGSPNVLVDPGHLQFFQRIEDHLNSLGYALSDIQMVICTHVHPDHYESVLKFRELEVVVGLHADDWNLATQFQGMIEAQGVRLDLLKPDVMIKEGRIELGSEQWRVIHTPGHSPGSICLYWENEKALISGDVLFNPGVGRTDLPGGSQHQIKASFERLRRLPLQHLLPGHGSPLSGSKQAQDNFALIEAMYL